MNTTRRRDGRVCGGGIYGGEGIGRETKRHEGTEGQRGVSGHGDIVNQIGGLKGMGPPHPHFKNQSSEWFFSSTQ